MRKIILSFLYLSLNLLVIAQRAYMPTSADLEDFLKSKTYVVLEASPFSDFNIEMKEIMTKIWNLTDFDFIKAAEFEKKSKDPSCSFIYTTYVTLDKDKTDSRYVFIHLALGGDNTSLNDLRDFVSIPLGYSGADPDNYNYKLGLFVRFMQKHIELIKEKPEVISSNVFNYYNKNMADVKEKTLYLIADELTNEVNSESKIKSVYPYKIKIVDKDEIRDAILEGDNNVVFLHKVGPEGSKLKARCYKFLVGAGDANIYYYHYHMVNPKNKDGFLLADFKRLVKSN